jgi:hypothetical protein
VLFFTVRLREHLGAGLARFAQPDGDRLLATLHLG